MTLTLDEVRTVAFPMAKRPNEGYKAGEVDDFLDRVEAAFSSLTEENERLNALIDNLSAGEEGHPAPNPDGLQGERDALKQQLEALQQQHAEAQRQLEELRANPPAPATPEDDAAELQRLRDENADLRQQLDDLQGRLDSLNNELTQARTAAEQASQQPTVEPGEDKVTHLVVTASPEASTAVTRLVQLATEQADQVLSEAQSDAARRLSEAEARATQLTMDAQARADRVESEARASAQQTTKDADEHASSLRAQAEANHEQVTSEIEGRRREMLNELESERDLLASKVENLRSFEASFRTNLVNELHSHIDQVNQGHAAPAETPALLSDDRTQSSTPRLDALLAEHSQHT